MDIINFTGSLDSEAKKQIEVYELHIQAMEVIKPAVKAWSGKLINARLNKKFEEAIMNSSIPFHDNFDDQKKVSIEIAKDYGKGRGIIVTLHAQCGLVTRFSDHQYIDFRQFNVDGVFYNDRMDSEKMLAELDRQIAWCKHEIEEVNAYVANADRCMKLYDELNKYIYDRMKGLPEAMRRYVHIQCPVALGGF